MVGTLVGGGRYARLWCDLELTFDLVIVTMSFNILSGLFLGFFCLGFLGFRVCFLSVCPSTFLFPDSNPKTLCPSKFKLDREIDHHHSYGVTIIAKLLSKLV